MAAMSSPADLSHERIPPGENESHIRQRSRSRARGQVEAKSMGAWRDVGARWDAFNDLAKAWDAGNSSLLRAMDTFAPAARDFKDRESGNEITGTMGDIPLGFPIRDGQRDAYLRAEESLAIARAQLGKQRELLGDMYSQVDGARRGLGLHDALAKWTISRAKFVVSDSQGFLDRFRRPLRQPLNANIYQHSTTPLWEQGGQGILHRGVGGCAMSPLEAARVLGIRLRMYQNEYELQETIVCSLGYGTAPQVLASYKATLSLRPFMEDRLLQQIEEVWALSQELRAQDKV